MEGQIPYHRHDGIDSPRLDPINFEGFRILTAAPTYEAREGTVLLALISGTYYLYARINKTWKSVTLT